jgi:hypothetical protein
MGGCPNFFATDALLPLPSEIISVTAEVGFETTDMRIFFSKYMAQSPLPDCSNILLVENNSVVPYSEFNDLQWVSAYHLKFSLSWEFQMGSTSYARITRKCSNLRTTLGAVQPKSNKVLVTPYS